MNADDLDMPGEWDDSGEPDHRERRGRRRALIGLAVIGALVAAVAIVIGLYAKSLDDSYQKRTVVTISRGASDGEKPAEGRGRNFLLLGSDRRSPEEAKASGIVGQRSDVMMLVHVAEDNQNVYVTSFPRDLYIDIPGHGKDRINAALAYGGVSLAVTTVENYTGVPIDHVALIDFEGIKGLVDTLGGETFTKGTQHMDGEEALVFVRARKQFADGDFQRNRNQQAVLKGIIAKLLSRDTLSNPLTLRDTIDSVSP